MCGGRLLSAPHADATFKARQSTIIGNTCLYGATGGELFAAGQAGDRFAVRNSGAIAVIEGTGYHCCEYMTGGVVLVLGRTGSNFAAGMTGGQAFVLDMDEEFEKRCNTGEVEVRNLDTSESSAERNLVYSLIEQHVEYTASEWGMRLLSNFEHYLFYFRAVIPKEIPVTKQTSLLLKVVK
ncbi:MAG: glutamate synthase (NADPH/NADH) large chain [Rhodothermales bacterium]|jgi:glutamate synthase (NADPH/NADH) large chain